MANGDGLVQTDVSTPPPASGMGIDQAERAVTLVREVIGDNVVGAYLHGSAVFGGFRPTSDIDLLVVAWRPTTRAEQRELIERLLPISGRGDSTGRSRSMELTIVVQSDVRPWHYPPRMDFQYGDWWRREFERGDLAPWESPNPDLALQLEMALQANHPLFGPRPAEVLDPVPSADVRRAMIDGIPALLADLEGDERNVVLTFARIWATLATGVIRTKDGAADWVLPRLPPEQRAVLAHARAIYLGETAEKWGDLLPRVRPHVDHVIGEIQNFARRADGGAWRGPALTSGQTGHAAILAGLTRPHPRRPRMHFEGSVEIAAPRDRVWAFVIDPQQVGQCGPGVETIEVIDPTHFKATAKVGIGFISARFAVNVEFAEMNPPDASTIKAHGQAPGSAVDGTAHVRLSDGPDGGTRLDWDADVNISGTIASVGARLIEGTATKMIAQTFDCMKSKLEAAG